MLQRCYKGALVPIRLKSVILIHLVSLTRSKKALPVVSINYRLSKLSPSTDKPLVQHPAHEEDVLSALLFLLSPESPCRTESITLSESAA